MNNNYRFPEVSYEIEFSWLSGSTGGYAYHGPHSYEDDIPADMAADFLHLEFSRMDQGDWTGVMAADHTYESINN